MPDHLYAVLRERAARWPEAVALGGQHGLLWRTLTSRELLERVDRLADELAALGVVAGDRVVTWLPSHWQTPIYFFAIWKLGAVLVPFDREMNPDAAARILASVEPRAILVGSGTRPPWAPEALTHEWWEPGTRATAPVSTLPAGEDPRASRSPSPAHREGVPMRTWGSPRPTASGEGDETDLATLVFTSGTTGNPKGCMITHANLLSQIDAASDLIPLDPDCRLASILPLSHLFELTCGLLYPLARGAAIHYVPSRRGPDILRVLNEQRITHMVVVPQLLTLMGQTLDARLKEKLPAPAYAALHALGPRLPIGARRRLFWPVHRQLGGQLRLMVAGGAALPPETQLLWERLGVRIVQGYGTSECSPVISGGRPDGSTPVGSVGRPIRNVRVRLSPEGELEVSGPNVMKGYWKDPERTAEVLHDGWYSTGDLARIDADGNIWLQGRAKELIVLPSGMNIWPEDVENALRADPAVKDAAILPVSTPAGGTVLHGYLLPAPGHAGAADLGRIVARTNGRLAQHQRLATASWWPEPDFPRTSTLKVRRHLLPQPETVQTVAVDATMAEDDPVGQAIAQAAKVPAVCDEQTLAELGLDSLGLVELSLAIEEKTGKTVGDADLQVDMTVAQVRQSLSGAAAPDEAPRVAERANASQPLWPYTWGRVFRFVRAPIGLLYDAAVTRTVVLGGEHLSSLPPRVILAGTHHAYADFPLLLRALGRTPARHLANRLVVAARASGVDAAGALAWYGILAFGVYPLRQYGERDASLRGLARLASEGNAVLIFPQGRHTHPEAELAGAPEAQFKPGVGHLATALDAVVVPFGVAGTERVMPITDETYRGPSIAGIPVKLRRGPLAVAFGPWLAPEPGETPLAFARRVQDACFALTRQAESALRPRGADRATPRTP